VPLVKCSNEAALEDRVLAEIGKIVGTERLHELKGEVASELRKRVSGYKRADSIGDWLTNVYFEHHVRLYKSRPIYWHLASSQQADPSFGVIIQYHRFGKDSLRKLRGSYVRGCLDRFEREFGHARKENRTDNAFELQQKIDEVRAFEKMATCIHDQQAHPTSTRCNLHLSRFALGKNGVGRVAEVSDRHGRRHPGCFGQQEVDAGDIPPRSVETADEADSDRVGALHKNDRDRLGRRFGCKCTIFEVCKVKKPNHGYRRLLRVQRERPTHRCSAEQRDEFAALHSITPGASDRKDTTPRCHHLRVLIETLLHGFEHVCSYCHRAMRRSGAVVH
jgi:hypothetical protein